MRMGDKILPISVLLAIPAVLLASFPFEALSFRAGDPSKRSSSFTAAVVSRENGSSSPLSAVAIRAGADARRDGRNGEIAPSASGGVGGRLRIVSGAIGPRDASGSSDGNRSTRTLRGPP